MAVTEVLQGLGSWSLTLKSDTPVKIRNILKYLGHIVVHTGPINPAVDRDALLKSSRYTGVLREKSDGDQITIGGSGMAYWLGDEDNKGEVLETSQTFNAPFHTVMAALLPDSVVAGTMNNIGSDFVGTIPAFMSPRQALNYVATTKNAEWRVNGDASVDVGLEAHLYVVGDADIDCLVERRGRGVDIKMKSFRGNLKTDQHLRDFTTRTVLLANGDGDAVAIGSADIAGGLNPYKDLLGNTVKLTRIISESTTSDGNADARAQLQLNRFSGTSDALTLNTSDFDVKGTVSVGDYAWVYDPDTGVVDLAKEVIFRGQRYNPMKLRITELSWPVTSNHSVAYRDPDGVWYDLTKYFETETSDTNIVVGGYSRALGNSGADGGVGGSRPIPNTSVPNAPTWNTPFSQSVYQSPVNGETKAQTELKWFRPTNTDGSTIVDGSHFEIRYRTASTPIFPSTHAQMASFTHAQLAAGTHQQPITYTPGAYQYQSVPWDQLSFLLQELVANMPYEAEIRAVDTGNPPNSGAWSALTSWQTSGDTLPPATPAPPVIAAGRISVQVKHTLGRSDGGTFNLDADLHHLEVHGEYEPLFTPSSATLLGKVIANNGMIVSQVAAVGSVPIESIAPVYFKVIAVDNDGNKSPASSAVQSTALLIDDAHISDLTVSKVTAGTITAQWLNAGRIWSGTDGAARVQLVPAGLEAYDATNTRTVFIEAATGNVTITGTFRTGTAGDRVVIDPMAITPSGVLAPAIDWYQSGSTTFIRGNFLNNVFLLAAKGTGTLATEGAYILFDSPAPANGSAYLGFRSTSGSIDFYHQVGSSGDHRFTGRFSQTETLNGISALWCGNATFGAGGFSVAFGYGMTMASVPAVLATVCSGNGTLFRWHVSGRSATGWSANIEGAAASPTDVAYWCFRYN